MADPMSVKRVVTTTLRELMGPKWRHKTTNGKYWVSTSDVMFSGWETMVFRIIQGKDINYDELDSERYSSEDQAYWGHIRMFQKWDEKE